MSSPLAPLPSGEGNHFEAFLNGGFVVCIHGSLQHELLHGHPTRSEALNKALVWLPIGLWMPYTIYRDNHIAHHRCERLTDPAQDPESFYIPAAAWSRYSPARRLLLRFNNTLLGRLTVGPVIAATTFLFSQASMLIRGNRRYASVWVWHLAGCAMTLYWVVAVCGMPFWQYVVLVASPCLSSLRDIVKPECVCSRKTAVSTTGAIWRSSADFC